jgi:hypothetical protein
MLGILLIAIAEIFAEASTSIGKYEVAKKKESLYAMAFLNAFWATVFLLAIGLFRGHFYFDLESLPTFLLRAILEIALVFVSLNAILTADRSTFAFLRTLTIPLLLVADFMLGYALEITQVAGVSLMVVAFLFLFFNHGLSRKGKLLSLVSAMIAVATITLYKYNITHYNSVEAEQTYMHVILLVAIIAAAKIRAHENVFWYLTQPLFITQSVLSGFASVFMSFAYVFAPASIIMAAKRAFEVLASIGAGRAVFKEKHLSVKLTGFSLLLLGVGLTML